jgi:hypothetical protein
VTEGPWLEIADPVREFRVSVPKAFGGVVERPDGAKGDIVN